MKSMRRRPRLAIEGVASNNVLYISFNFYCFLSRRKTRRVLNVSKIVAKILISSPTPAHAKARMMIVRTTMIKSNKFQPFLK